MNISASTLITLAISPFTISCLTAFDQSDKILWCSKFQTIRMWLKSYKFASSFILLLVRFFKIVSFPFIANRLVLIALDIYHQTKPETKKHKSASAKKINFSQLPTDSPFKTTKLF